MSGRWDRMDDSWWPAVAGSLPRPWPREAACFDLRWWVGQGRTSEKTALPGRPTLAARWGWTDWSVRGLLRDEQAWRDPHLPAESTPAHRQRTASAPPAGEQYNADSSAESASAPPAVHQRNSTRARFTSSPLHDSRMHENTPPAHAAPPRGEPGSHTAGAGGDEDDGRPGEDDRTDGGEAQSARGGSNDGGTGATAAPAVALFAPAADPDGSEQPGSGTRRGGRGKPTPRQDHDGGGDGPIRVWLAWREYHPRVTEDTPPAPQLKAIQAALKHVSVDVLIGISAWAHTSPHPRATFLRGEGYKPGGGGAYLSIKSLFVAANLLERRGWWEDWEAEGRPDYRDKPTTLTRANPRNGASMFDQLAAMMAGATADADLEVIDA